MIMFSRPRSAGVLTVALGVALVVPGVALADPLTPGSETFELMCGGDAYEVVVAGNGSFTPAHDVDSNRVFVPTYFGEGTSIITNVDTGEVEEFIEPAEQKGKSTKARSTSAVCTFSTTFEFHDEETGEHFIGTFSGSVGGFYTPNRP